MRKRSKTPNWLMPAILVTGVVVLWSGMAKAAKPQASNVQTAIVGDRVYSINRLGQGTYLVTLVSTGGVLEASPVNLTFNQAGPMADFGDPGKIARLRDDLNQMNVSFK